MANTPTADIRQYLTSAYSDEELATLCSDYFRDVYDNFAAGMTKTGKILLLLDHCQRRDLISNLLAALERDRPDQYRKRFQEATAQPSLVPLSQGRDSRQVFISHAHEDADFAYRLAFDLRARGWRVWIAPDSIRPGEKWAEAIDRGLDESGIFVLVLTPSAVNSGWVKTETYAAIELAQRGEAQFIPAEVVSCHPPMTWRAFQRVPFAGRYESGLAALLAAIGAPAPRANADERRLQGAGSGASPVPAAANGTAAPKTDPKTAPKDTASDAAKTAASVASGDARPAIVTPDLLTIESPVHLELVRVPAGEFLMGSDPARDKLAYGGEQPQHRLSLPEFYIGKYPVTNTQYAAFVKAAQAEAPAHWKKGQIPTGKENHPVVNVSWHDAIAFCRWLSGATDRTFSLPTEAEWEKAARGVDGRIYPWGSDRPDDRRCNFGERVGDTTPVGKYPAGAGPCGALDMAGNVWEWTSSLWGENEFKPEFGYPYDAKDGREDLNASDTVLRVFRGGLFKNGAQDVRCACRFRFFPGSRSVYYGFRVVSPGF